MDIIKPVIYMHGVESSWIQYTTVCIRCLMQSDKIIKYGISKSIINGLYYNIVGNKIIIRTCIMDSEMPYLLEWNLKVKMEISVFQEYQYRAKQP